MNLSQPRLCECGEPLKSFAMGEVVHYAKLCGKCSEKALKKTVLVELRAKRQERARIYRQRLEYVIPPLFKDAHLRKLNRPFRDAILDFNPTAGLVLYGPVGRGKSFALAALARLFITKKRNVCRITYEMLCLKLRDTYKANSEKTELDVIQPLINCDYLIVEDVGSTTSLEKNESDFSVRTFFVLLDSRLEAGKPTLISTNKSKENLTSSFNDRIASRLSPFKWVGAGGNDKRREK